MTSSAAATAGPLSPPVSPRRDKVLLAIAVFKFAKCVLLIAVACGALKLLHHSFSRTTVVFVERLTSEPEHHVLHQLLEYVLAIDDRKLRAISAASFLYAALLALEGTGLWLQRRWGEYFTIIITGSFIPFELYELTKHHGIGRVTITALNIAAVAYLVVRVRRERAAEER